MFTPALPQCALAQASVVFHYGALAEGIDGGVTGKLKGRVDLRFAHAVGDSRTVLPFAAGLLVVGGAVVVEMLGQRQASLLVWGQSEGQESAREG